ncbi:MAG: ABC transporter permease [Ruminococcus flavefaciens]|nr:ABC transporter permease [Ruminococcus flavefaciens]MCM1231191.1 ABC transporter permease [Ruminococcus flavefaciens]
MKNKKILYAVLAVANAVSLAGTLALTIWGSSLAKSQGYNNSAEKWDSDGGCSQISCFFSEEAGITTDNIGGAKASMLTSLQNISIVPEENQKLIPEAYSTSAGQATIRSDTTNGRSTAELVAVGGDFFLFRDFSLLDGAYFSDNDIMQDGAVIDRNLAWALYGSDSVSGKNIYIDGTKFYIAGVIDTPKTKQEKKTAGELPVAYITYSGANLLNNAPSADMGDGFMPTDTGLKKITCYECIVPDPVENYAYNAIDSYFKQMCENNYDIVNNSERFNPSVRAKAFKNLSDYAVIKNAVIYPYWENASRIVEFQLTSIYFYRRLTYIIPVLTILYLLIILWKTAGRARRLATEWTGDKITRIIYNHNERQKKKKENI